MEGGQVNHIWHMGVVGHSYVGFSGGMDGVGGW